MTAGVLPRVGQCGSDEGALAGAQIFGPDAEMLFGHRRDAVDAFAHLYRIEVDLHDALLGPEEFDEGGKVDLKAFARPAAPWPKEHVLGCLLRDGAGTKLTLLRVLPITDGSILNGLVVEAVMVHEVGIFAGDDGHGHRW